MNGLTNGDVTVPTLHLAMSLDIGGAETQVVGLTKSLKDSGWPVYIASNGGRRVADLDSSGITHYQVPLHSRSPLRMLEASRKVSALVDDLGIQIVHAHARIPAWIAEGICRKRGIKLVTTYHGTYVSGAFWNMVTKPGDLTIAVSQDVKDYVIREFGFDPRRTVVVPNGIDTEMYSPPAGEEVAAARTLLGLEPASGPVLVYASRMDEGLSATAILVIDAVFSLLAEYPAMVLVVAGDGDNLPNVRDRALKVNRTVGRNAILCPGFVLDTAPLYRAGDLVLGMSRVALEAMACGRPTIIVGPGGMFGISRPETLKVLEERNFTTRGAPEPASPEAIAGEIRHLLSDPELGESLGRWARDTVLRDHSMDMMAAKIERLYRELLG